MATSERMNLVDYRTDPRLDPQVRSFLRTINADDPPRLEELSVDEARRVLVDLQASVDVDLSGIEVTDRTIESGDRRIDLHIVRPEGAEGRLPVFVFLHGGGWLLGDFPTFKRMVRDLVVLTGYCAVFVDYTRTPEARYPVALEEIYAATRWIAEHPGEIDVDAGRLAVVGTSAGGTMATVTALIAGQRGGPDIKFQVLFWPSATADPETASYEEFAEDRYLTASGLQYLYDLYIPDPRRRRESYASPLHTPLKQLAGLPPALIQVAENDILRDEAEAYGRKLAEAGVATTTVRYLGMIHDFGLLNAFATHPVTRAALRQAAVELRAHLS